MILGGRYYITDIESGNLIEVSQYEYTIRESIRKFVSNLSNKVKEESMTLINCDSPKLGKVIIVGTMSELYATKNTEFIKQSTKDLFYNSDFKLKENSNIPIGLYPVKNEDES